MNVLSLFDGISCGQLALNRAGVHYDNYFASEIKEKAIEVTQKNFPNTIQLGNIEDMDKWELPQIDLIIGGSPCQNLSQTVVSRIEHDKGLNGEKSRLFYNYLMAIIKYKPKYFLLENVASMKDKDKEIITRSLGVEPVMINSSRFSAQDRERYYWTNIPVGALPSEKKIVLRDIMELEVKEKYFYKLEQYPKSISLDSRVVGRLNINGHDMIKRVYSPDFKAPTLTGVTGGNHQKKVYQNGRIRKLTPTEYERLQTLPDGYTEGVSDTARWDTIGNGWTVDVIAHIFEGLL